MRASGNSWGKIALEELVWLERFHLLGVGMCGGAGSPAIAIFQLLQRSLNSEQFFADAV